LIRINLCEFFRRMVTLAVHKKQSFCQNPQERHELRHRPPPSRSRCAAGFCDPAHGPALHHPHQQLLGGEHPHAWQPTPASAVFLAGNDYLCLAGEPALVGAQIAALQHSAGELLMSAVYLQQGSPQHRLERKLAQFMGAEDGILAQSGWAANVGLVQTLAGPGIPVYLDMQAHASLWEGVQSAGATPVSFLHNDMEHLQKQLQRHGRGLIVVDALYSTNGSLAPLAELVEIAERSGCMLLVDESHSLGTHGPRGAGLVAAPA
jgi:CAI-1 autoinducer synthase